MKNQPIVEEVPPDMDFKTGPTISSPTGNFTVRKEAGVWYDKWTWASGWPTGSWDMGGTTTSPVSGTTLKTRAQEFLGSATSISPSGSGTSYQIWYQSTRVGHVYVDASAKTAQWYMYQTTYTTTGPLLPTPTDTAPLSFVPGTAVSGTGWVGTDK
ncbi:MAG: hypothetical protein KC549_08475 [Myxococcales bacterium]|nr:hypothetical protein [Myxococcales bacterium]MCB9546047.1 hypothetical protein [Myxococcales bacterium]